MAVGDCYQITLSIITNGKECNNTLWYKEGADNPAPPVSIAQELTDQVFQHIWLDYWKPLLTSDSRLVSIMAQMKWPTAHEGYGQPFAGENGTAAGESIPNGSTALISYKGVNKTQNFWRRLYLSGLPSSWVQDSLFTEDATALVNALATRIRTKLLDSGSSSTAFYSPIAFSKALSLEAGSTPWSILDEQTVRRNVRSQRQRNLVVA